MSKHFVTVQYTWVLTEQIEIEADSCDEANEKAVYEMNMADINELKWCLKNRIQTEGRLRSEILIGA
jgi:hypothetical protein